VGPPRWRGHVNDSLEAALQPSRHRGVRKRGADVLPLLRCSEYLNPIELLFKDLKQHCLRPAFEEHGGPMTYANLLALICRYTKRDVPAHLPGFFAAR